MKKHGAFWMHLYPLLLFAIIVLSLLFLVMTGTGLYSAVVDSQTRNREARAALSYLAARVHAADAAGAVSVGEGPEGAALLLRENADGETYETRIYLYEGAAGGIWDGRCCAGPAGLRTHRGCKILFRRAGSTGSAGSVNRIRKRGYRAAQRKGGWPGCVDLGAAQLFMWKRCFWYSFCLPV